jgi:hypothetical protein
MKLPDRSRPDETLDPEVETELAAIDAALAGGPVPRDSEELAQLARELRDERSEPSVAFAAQLDRWAESGFSRSERRARGGGAGAGAGAGKRGDRFGGLVPRWAIPAGGLAALAVVVGIGISVSGPQSGDGGVSIQSTPSEEPATLDAADGADNGAATAESTVDGARAPESTVEPVPPGPGTSLDAPAQENRKVVRSADLTLAAEPEEIREVSDGVNAVTNRYEGIVVSSSVQSGDADTARASSQFQLRIPAANLQAALADLSELAHVQSRTEGTEDITGQFLSARERMEELEAERESLLNRLAKAETEDAAEALRRQVDVVNSQLRATRGELESARQRVRFVPVSVSILAEEGAADDGNWGIEEAVEDAGDVLSTAAGVALVAGAVLLPIAVVALLAALAFRARTSRARDRALND